MTHCWHDKPNQAVTMNAGEHSVTVVPTPPERQRYCCFCGSDDQPQYVVIQQMHGPYWRASEDEMAATLMYFPRAEQECPNRAVAQAGSPQTQGKPPAHSPQGYAPPRNTPVSWQLLAYLRNQRLLEMEMWGLRQPVEMETWGLRYPVEGTNG